MRCVLRTLPLALLLCLALSLPVCADLIALPPSDSFYRAHSDDCRYEPHDYATNGTKGYVTLWYTPEMQSKYDNAANGLTFYGPYIYTAPDGAEWISVQSEDPRDDFVWALMADCALLQEDGMPADGVELIPPADHIPYVFRLTDAAVLLIAALCLATFVLIRRLFSRKTRV